MGLTDRLPLRVMNDLAHDVTAGVVPGAVLALWLVRNGAKASLGPEALATMVRGWSWIVLVLFVAVVIFVVTGSIRVTYRTLNIRKEALEAQGRSALIKHAVFVPLFVYAAVVAFTIIQP
jgi:hypothetical protein